MVARFNPVEHHTRGMDFGRAYSGRAFNIHDDGMLAVDQVIDRVGVFGGAVFIGARPASFRINGRQELRLDRR